MMTALQNSVQPMNNESLATASWEIPQVCPNDSYKTVSMTAFCIMVGTNETIVVVNSSPKGFMKTSYSQDPSRPFFWFKNKRLLQDKYQKEVEYHNGELQEVGKSIYDFAFSKTASKLAELPFNFAAVEIVIDEVIQYRLTFPEERLLILSQDISADNISDDFIYSIFVNRQLILSDAAPFNEIVEGFKRYIQS